jgi:hypothetical protein
LLLSAHNVSVCSQKERLSLFPVIRLDLAAIMQQSYASQMKPIAAAAVSTAALSAALLFPKAALATIIVNLTGQTGTSAPLPTRSFSEGDLEITFDGSSLQGFVASSSNGLCLYANTQDGSPRCGIDVQGGTYNSLIMTSNRDIFLTGGVVSQTLGAANPITVSPSIGLGGAIPGSNVVFSFGNPIFLSASQPITFTGFGTNTATRIGSFSFEEVPGPLPLFGAAAAFGASRRIRKKLKLLS